MARDDTEFETLLRRAMRDLGAGADHLPPETLAAHHDGRLDAEGAATVAEHLASCPACATTAGELRRFRDDVRAEAAAARQLDAEGEAEWQALRARLAGEVEAATEPPPVARPRFGRPSRGAAYLALALAASLALSVGLGLRLRELRARLDAVEGPLVNVPIVNLEPTGAMRSGPELEVVAGDAPRFVLVLNPVAIAAPGAVHRVEVVEAGGVVRWSAEGLLPTDVGTFHLELTRTVLPPGSYRLLLSGPAGAVETFPLEIRP